jgi:hypothetical protein
MNASRPVLLTVALALLSCGHQAGKPAPDPSQPPAAITAPRTSASAFDHTDAVHATIDCESCHARDSANPSAVEPNRPPHTACSTCHSSENYLDASSSEPICAVCHPAKQILDASLKTRLSPFPARLNQFGVGAFSHRTHTDDTKMSPHPDDYSCAFCHAARAGLAPKGFPAHAECYSCHVHQASQKFGRCQDCHAPTAESLVFSHAEGTATRDYNFQHSGHTRRKDGSAIPCAACHTPNPEKPRVSDIALMQPQRGKMHTSTCWGTCHIQSEENRCGKCHVRGIPLPVRAG